MDRPTKTPAAGSRSAGSPAAGSSAAGSPAAGEAASRLRYGRLTAVGGAALVTCVALLSALGLLPSGGEPAYADPPAGIALESAVPASGQKSVQKSESKTGAKAESKAESQSGASPSDSVSSSTDAAERAGSDPGSAEAAKRSGAGTGATRPDAASGKRSASKASATLPADSGTGRRAVFSQSEQQVWIVGADGEVRRTYLVSGSVYDNLEPGTYEVWSRSENAVGIEDSGTMKYFVRFTRGPSGAAIGFHDIPVKDGELLQSFADLGTAQSHGCIRQKRSDARAMWRFAGLGTTVVVTA